MNNELKRLRRLIVVSWMALLVVVISFVIWISTEVKNTKSIALASLNKQVQPIKGFDGKNGESIIGPQGLTGNPGTSGQNGTNGIDGKNATSVTTIIKEPEIIQQNIPVPGPQGNQGSPGIAGREVQLGKNLLGNVVWRYVGDEGWQDLEIIN